MRAEKNDRLIQGMAGVGDFRVVAVEIERTLEEIRRRADLSPVATIALGRTIAGALLLARLLDKNQTDQQVTVRVEGGGPLGLVIAEANTLGATRGYVSNPRVDLGSLDVGEAVGRDGVLTVVRTSVPTGRTYSSRIRLVTGEIARDLTEYLLVSEQVRSAVLLGVQVCPSGVESAGGMAVRRFPHGSDVQAGRIESALASAPAFSSLLARMPLEDAVSEILRGNQYKALAPSFAIPVEFRCSCSRDRALAPYAILRRAEIQEMIEDEGGSTATCQFCGAVYEFSAAELEAWIAAQGMGNREQGTGNRESGTGNDKRVQ